MPGAYDLAAYLPLLRNRAIGVVVNHTSQVGNTHLVDTLLNSGITIRAIFSPEHGFMGNAPDGEKINDALYKDSIHIYSLYGKDRKPDPEELAGIEYIVFDIQDVGARFYTYLSTMHAVMEAGAEQNIPVLILDRPNPNGHFVDGPVMDMKFSSFVGLHPVPVVYGMTIGEYAQMINGEGWLNNGIQCDLTIIKCANYDHQTPYNLPIAPSPNLPNQRAVLLYPSLCILEGTTFSVGRGTDIQFQVYGHPSYVNSNIRFTPNPNSGSKYPKHQGKECAGNDLSELSTDTIFKWGKLNLEYLLDAHASLQSQEISFYKESNQFERLWGTDKLREQLSQGFSEEKIRSSWAPDLEKFKAIRAKYLLYDDFKDR